VGQKLYANWSCQLSPKSNFDQKLNGGLVLVQLSYVLIRPLSFFVINNCHAMQVFAKSIQKILHEMCRKHIKLVLYYKIMFSSHRSAKQSTYSEIKLSKFAPALPNNLASFFAICMNYFTKDQGHIQFTRKIIFFYGKTTRTFYGCTSYGLSSVFISLYILQGSIYLLKIKRSRWRKFFNFFLFTKIR
jgi:hypothetical protein